MFSGVPGAAILCMDDLLLYYHGVPMCMCDHVSEWVCEQGIEDLLENGQRGKDVLRRNML